MKYQVSLTTLLALVNIATARTVFSALSVNDIFQGQGVAIRVPSSSVPITDINSPDIICNKNYIQPVSQTVAKVPMGSKVTAHFHHQPAGYLGPDPADPLDPTNKGPLIAYLAAVPSATQANVSGLKWFKIWEDGYDTTTHQWGSDHIFNNKGNATFSLPECIAAGEYLLRVEAIALHQASSYPGAQFYMSCAQISVTGSSKSIVAPATVSFPGAYKSTDPGIVTFIYGLTSYTPPGPTVFAC